jgi:hypothetical protein
MSIWTRITRSLLSSALDGPPVPPAPDYAPPHLFRSPPRVNGPLAARRRSRAGRASRAAQSAPAHDAPPPPTASATTLGPTDSRQPPIAPLARRPRPFQPTAKQRALAEAACGLALPLSTTQLCSRAGVSPRSFYRWQNQPGFSAWFAAAALQALATATPLLILSAMQSAIDGDPAARKLMFQFCVTPDLAPALASRLGWAGGDSPSPEDPGIPALAAAAEAPAAADPPRRRPRRALAAAAQKRAPMASLAAHHPAEIPAAAGNEFSLPLPPAATPPARRWGRAAPLMRRAAAFFRAP